LQLNITTNGPVTVKALGFYDDLKNGLNETHTVGIYDSAGALLVSAPVTSADPRVGFFRMHNIATQVLPGSQSYFIMGVTGSENYTWITNGFTIDSSINFVQDAYFTPFSGVLVFPNGFNATGSDGYFGPNFSTTAPLPSTLVFLGSGLIGLISLGRRRLS
jgi:hypothetical protein